MQLYVYFMFVNKSAVDTRTPGTSKVIVIICLLFFHLFVQGYLNGMLSNVPTCPF